MSVLRAGTDGNVKVHARSSAAVVQTAHSKMQRTQGACEISTKRRDERSVLNRFRQEGAFKALFPITHGRAPIEIVLVNTSGGLTGGDKMNFGFSAGAHTDNIITTQACEKFYKSLGDHVETGISIEVGDGARVVWIPQESILFRDSRIARSIDATLGWGASLVMVEAVVFGREAHGEKFDRGLFTDRWRISQSGGRLVHAEQVHFNALRENRLHHASLLGENGAIATILAIGEPHFEETEFILSCANSFKNVRVGGSAWSVGGVQKTVFRFAAKNSYELRPAIGAIVKELTGGAVPKVWRI